MANNKFQGCWPVAPTPFKDNGELDIEGMKEFQIAWWIKMLMAFVYQRITPSSFCYQMMKERF